MLAKQAIGDTVHTPVCCTLYMSVDTITTHFRMIPPKGEPTTQAAPPLQHQVVRLGLKCTSALGLIALDV